MKQDPTNNNANTIAPKRCAIYTRKSTEEGLEMEFNSLDAQREACECYIASQKHEGWLLLDDHFDDGGFTGGNMERPALKRLIQAIELGLIDIVVVYKVDRLSRSLADFAKLISLFDTHHISFVSVTQQFNTTTSMGRLTLNILLSFAQFEREVIGERVRDKFAASKRKGLWMGGTVPLGYDVIDKQLQINETEAASVRALFDLFLKTKSPTKMVQPLVNLGIVSKQRTTKKGNLVGGAPLDIGAIYKILNNPVYIGKTQYKNELYDGRHQAIVTQETWEATQQLLRQRAVVKKREAKPEQRAVLSGLLKCSGCLSSMTPVHTTKCRGKKRYRYYAATGYKQGRCPDCPIKQISAGEIETLVLQHIQTVFATPEMILDTWIAAKHVDDSITETDIRHALTEIAPIWQALFPAEQKRLLNLLLTQVVLHPNHLDVQLRCNGIHNLAQQLQKAGEKSCKQQ